jgi:hypothetical protein
LEEAGVYVQKESRMRKAWIMGALGFGVALGSIALYASAAVAQGGPTTVVSGLSGPQGVLVGPDGSVWVIETGTGGDQELSVPALNTNEPLSARFGARSLVLRGCARAGHERRIA